MEKKIVVITGSPRKDGNSFAAQGILKRRMAAGELQHWQINSEETGGSASE